MAPLPSQFRHRCTVPGCTKTAKDRYDLSRHWNPSPKFPQGAHPELKKEPQRWAEEYQVKLPAPALPTDHHLLDMSSAANLMNDPDEDADMRSTSSSDTIDEQDLLHEPSTHYNDEETEFPQGHTPLNDHLNASAPGELSPPRSHSMSQAPGDFNLGLRSSNGHGNMGYGDDIDERQIRSGNKPAPWKEGDWRSKRSQDEHIRAMENVIDRDYNPQEYGDPMGPSELNLNPTLNTTATAQQGQSAGQQGKARLQEAQNDDD